MQQCTAVVQLPIKHSITGFNTFMALPSKKTTKLYLWIAINLGVYDVTKVTAPHNSPGQAHWNRSFASLDASRTAERPTFNQVLAALVYQKTAQLRACLQFIWTIRLTQKAQHEELLHSTNNCKTEFFSVLTKRPHLYLYLQAIKMDDLLQPWSQTKLQGIDHMIDKSF